MLRAVAFRNFLCFEDHQSLGFQNGPNFIVGANATGKSAIFELIRRCLSRTASSSDSSVTDKSKDAFVICKFKVREELLDKVPAGCTLYSLYVKYLIGGNEDKHKLVCITNEEETHAEYYLDCYDGLKATLKGDKKDVLEAMKSLITKGSDTNQHLKTISSMIPGVTERGTEEALSDCEAVLKELHDVVVVTFPIRSPGPIQWSHSKNIGEGNEHYVTASNNAEILQRLIGSKDVNEEMSEDIFQTIINPLKYTFQKHKKGHDSIITVNDGQRLIQLLKVPEGIIEAKQFSLMFAHKKFQTLMLEEPDRAMHPQMIQKMRDKSIRGCKDQKTLILTSHQPVMLNRWTMSRLYVCRKKRVVSGNFKHFIYNWGKDVKNTHQHQDQLKQMLYSAAVLFVEGITDKSVIGWVFDRVLDTDFKDLTDFAKEELAELKEIIAGTQIISMEGGKGYQHLTQVAEDLEVPFVFLLDADIVFKYPKDVQQRKEINTVYDTFTKESSKNVNVASIMDLLSKCELDAYAAKNFDLPPDSKDFKATKDCLKEKKNIFIWDSRNLEVMILKSIVDIRDQLIDKNMIGFLKKKSALLEMDMETAGTLAECLLKGEEMRVFLKFLLKTRMQP